jgi:toxin ParE1/3/4
MTSLIVAADADADFDDIFAYLRREAGTRVAVDYGLRFNTTLQRLLKFPESGAPRPMLGQTVRVAVVSPYILIYEYVPEDDVMLLLRVLHERRNIARELLHRR